MMRHVVAVVAAFALAGCSNSTAPTDLAGTWTLTSTNLTGAGGNCTLTGQVQFTQSGTTLGGNLPNSGVVVTCSATSSAQATGNDLIFGHVSGTGVLFNLATGFVVATGNITGAGAMTGSMVVWYPASQINVTGTWTATLNSQ
jgi:hypothetical protein